MIKVKIKTKEIQLLALFGVLTLLFISVNFANNYSPQGNYIFDNYLPKSAAVTVNIISPSTNDNFSAAPAFIVKISEDADTIDTMWYTLNGGINIKFTENGTINSGNWTALSDGAVTLTFYANNTLGGFDFESVDINKVTINPPIDFDFIAFLLSPLGLTIIGVAIAIVVVVILVKRRGHHKTSNKEVKRIAGLWD